MPELCRDKFSGWRADIGARILTVTERACASLADRVLAVHDLHAERLTDAGISSEKIRVVINSPDGAIFKRTGAAKQRPDVFSMVCHGTVTRRLGLDTALEALAILSREPAKAPHLTIIGDGDHLATLKLRASELGVGSFVAFKTSVPVELLPPELVSASVGLAPYHGSAATHLMLPVKALEYATLGVPIVCARLRTIERYFGTDTVEYFEPDDAQGLADAIQRLRSNPLRCAQIADRAWQVSVELGWEQQRVRLFDAIDSILPARHAAATAQEQSPASDAHNPIMVREQR
jgi:glycosyltransferase involved in cell wall biosynthesis